MCVLILTNRSLASGPSYLWSYPNVPSSIGWQQKFESRWESNLKSLGRGLMWLSYYLYTGSQYSSQSHISPMHLACMWDICIVCLPYRPKFWLLCEFELNTGNHLAWMWNICIVCLTYWPNFWLLCEIDSHTSQPFGLYVKHMYRLSHIQTKI